MRKLFFLALSSILIVSCVQTTTVQSGPSTYGKRVISSPEAPAAVGPYSQAIYANNTLYVSGQLPVDSKTGQMPESVADQTRQSLTNIGYILKEAGLDFSDVVKATVYLTDMGTFSEMNAVYAEFFTENMPARVCCEVSALPKGANVEIDAIACYSNSEPVDMAGE